MKKMLLVLAVVMVVLTGCNRKDNIEHDPIIKNKSFNRVSYVVEDEEMVEENSEGFFATMINKVKEWFGGKIIVTHDVKIESLEVTVE